MRWPKLLIIIVLLGALLRFVKISEIPYGFDGDEAAFGYYGYSLLRNLSDEYGNKLPIYFPSIGDYKYPVYAYLTAIPVAILGLTEFSARFVSAFSGTLLMVAIYFLTKRLFSSDKIPLVSALLIAISPYGIMFSRGAYESNLATLLVTLGIWMIVEFSKLRKVKYLYLSAIFFVLASFTYSATRVFMPAFLILYGVYLFKDKGFDVEFKKYYFVFSLILIAIISLAFLDPRSRVRASDISIFSNYKIGENIRESIWEDGIANPGNVFTTWAFHNKVLVHPLFAFEGYLDHFNPTYFFVTSNPLMFKYSIPGVGLFYFFEAITFILGIAFLAKQSKGKSTYIVILWIILSPIVSALTVETPNPIRALVGFPALAMLSATGLVFLLDIPKNKLSKNVIALLIFGFVLSNLLCFIHQYFIHDKYHEPWNTDGGIKELVVSVGGNEGNYEKVVISNDPYIFFLFYNKVHPKETSEKANLEKIELGRWEYVNEFGKLVFKMPNDCPKIGRLNVLYVCKGTEIPQNSNVLDIIRFSDGVPPSL